MKGFLELHACVPIGLFAIFDPQDQESGEFYVVKERWVTDFEGLEVVKGSVGFPGILRSCSTRLLFFHIIYEDHK